MSSVIGCAVARSSRPTQAALDAANKESDTPGNTANMGNNPQRADLARLPLVGTPASRDALTGNDAIVGQSSWWQDEPVRLVNADVNVVPFGSDRTDYLRHGFAVASPELMRLPLIEDSPLTFADVLKKQWDAVRSDHVEFYSTHSLTWLAAGVGAGSLMANTGFDENFRGDMYVENIVRAPSHEYYERLHQPKFLGNGYYTIPAFAVLALAEPLVDDLPLGAEAAEWGQRSLRTFLVGGPPVLGLQQLTGGSRPGETSAGSRWTLFRDDNGVSGHSFMGAIPFLSAAKMSENVWLRSGLYAASALPALSRVNDDDHYFSQAFLGWWLAYVAASAVDCSHLPAHTHVFLYPQRDGVGLGFEYRRK